MAKAAGPGTIYWASPVCMYVANTRITSTSWVIPWMHTQLGSSGRPHWGRAAALKALHAEGQDKNDPLIVIAFCGDGAERIWVCCPESWMSVLA